VGASVATDLAERSPSRPTGGEAFTILLSEVGADNIIVTTYIVFYNHNLLCIPHQLVQQFVLQELVKNKIYYFYNLINHYEF
jgi:hypothetical protein